MRILFDQGTPAYERGWSRLTNGEWSRLTNGELLDAAEEAGFEALVTTDANLKYQQNLKARRIAIVVLSTPSWPRIEGAAADILRSIEDVHPGGYAEVDIP